MLELITFAGWVIAAAGVCAAAIMQHRLAERMELVARASHEVRGPLTAARLALHGLTELPTSATDRIAAIDFELRRAGFALEDLAAAQNGGRAPELSEPIEVGELLRDAVAAWRPVADAFGNELRMTWGGPATLVRGDRLRLAQACGNLLANAVEHGGRRIELRGRTTPDSVRIEVIDDGPGLPAPVADLAGEARAGRGRRGRGLAIASEIAARHGGRIAAGPSDGGARVALELPMLAELA